MLGYLGWACMDKDKWIGNGKEGKKGFEIERIRQKETNRRE